MAQKSAVSVYACNGFGTYDMAMLMRYVEALNSVQLDPVAILDSIPVEIPAHIMNPENFGPEMFDHLRDIEAGARETFLSKIPGAPLNIDEFYAWYLRREELRCHDAELRRLDFLDRFRSGALRSGWELVSSDARHMSMMDSIAGHFYQRGMHVSFYNDILVMSGPGTVFQNRNAFLNELLMSSRTMYHDVFRRLAAAFGSGFILYADDKMLEYDPFDSARQQLSSEELLRYAGHVSLSTSVHEFSGAYLE